MSNIYYLLAAQASSFLTLPLSQTQSVRTNFVPYYSLCSTCVTYRASCHSTGHQVLPNQLLPREAGDFLWGWKYSKDVSLPAILSYMQQVWTKLWIDIHICQNHECLSQSPANLGIYQNFSLKRIFFKISPSENTFSRSLS